MVGSSTFCVFLFVRARHSYRATNWERCWPLPTGLWRAVAPLTKPWCAEGDVPTAANLNLCRGRFSRVAWHSDNEPQFGERGESKLIVSMSFGTGRSSSGRASPVRTVKLTRAGLTMVIFWSWMVNVRTSSFIVRIPVWSRSGLTLRSDGSNNILLPIPF